MDNKEENLRNLLIVTTSIGHGGAERALYSLLQGCRGYQVTLVSLSSDDLYKQKLIAIGVNVISLYPLAPNFF